MQTKSLFFACFRPYEQSRKAELEKFLATIRIYYAAFCSVLLFAVIQRLRISVWVAQIFIFSALAYSLIRYLTPTYIPEESRLPPLVDYLDFVFIGILIYLTGGIKSIFHVAHTLPICGGIMRFGLWGGVSSYITAATITIIMLFLDTTLPSFPVTFHVIAGTGTLAFATWMLLKLIEKEWELRDNIYLSSITDHLTGLYNSGYLRRRIEEEIHRSRREKSSFAIAFLDLDNFKKINDKYGHLAGDEILRSVAKIFKENVRESDILARYGGDEFVLLMPGAGRREGGKLVQRLQQVVNSNYLSLNIRISAGIAAFPEDGGDVDSLLTVADQRMYQSKI